MASDNYDLDLLEVESTDLPQLASKINGYYNTDSTLKMDLAYHWERNHLMLDGKQWIVYDNNPQTGRQWSQLRVSTPNEYIPRPVTNYLYDIYQTLKAYLVQHKPRSTVRPNTQSLEDRQAAKLSELVLECNWERLKETENYEYAAAVGLTYGTVFKRTFWDTSSLQKAKLPKVEVQPVTDPMTGAVVGQKEVEVLDELGMPVYEEVPLGDVNTEIIEPFRMSLDPLASDLHKARWVMEYDIMPLDTIKQLYGKQEEGYTGEALNVKPEKTLNNVLRRFYELRTSSGVKLFGTSVPGTNAAGGTDNMIENACVVKKYYEKPCEKYPNGRLVVVAGDKVLYVGNPDSYGNEIDSWHPYSEFRWEIYPGRFWGRSPFDAASELQKRINSIDSAIILTRKTMAIPQKLIPKGSGIKEGEWTGRPGQQIEFRSVEGQAPQTVPASGVDASVFQERVEILESIKNITGAVDVLKGDRPPGVTAASALELLYEVSTGKLRPTLDRWKRFIECDQKKQLWLIGQKYQEPREDFIRLLTSKNKEFSEDAIKDFLGADIQDNCNVIIEAGSNVPKLQSARKSELLQLAQAGVLQLEAPENRMKFLEEFGLSTYSQDVSPDIKRAEWENSMLDDIAKDPTKQQQVIVMDFDEHEVHKQVHHKRMKEPAWMFMPIEVQQAYMMHVQQHEEAIEQMQQLQMMQTQMSGMPPQPGQEGIPEQELAGRGKGIPNSTAEQLSQVDMPPDAKVAGG